ncbi:MAG: hypothetical protein ABI592_01055 [Acidobacteriota bacterium]
MSFALLLTTALALAGFLVTSTQGFAVAGGIAAHSLAMKTLVGRHFVFAIPTVLLSLFSQSMTIFYFIGTGRLVKDEVASYPEPQKTVILRALRRFKARTSPPATFALFSAILVFVLGGAVHTRFLSPWTHLAASMLAVALHLWALVAQWAVFRENNRLMDDPRRYALEAGSPAAR